MTDFYADSKCSTSNIAVTAPIFFPGTLDLGWFAQLTRDEFDSQKAYLYIGVRKDSQHLIVMMEIIEISPLRIFRPATAPPAPTSPRCRL